MSVSLSVSMSGSLSCGAVASGSINAGQRPPPTGVHPTVTTTCFPDTDRPRAAHVLATTHFSRWDEKFAPQHVSQSTLPAAARRHLVAAAGLRNGVRSTWPTHTSRVEAAVVEVGLPGSLPDSGQLPAITKNGGITASSWGTRAY